MTTPPQRASDAEREQEQRLAATVDELAAHVRRHACQLAALDVARLVLDQERQSPLEHEVDLLLA